MTLVRVALRVFDRVTPRRLRRLAVRLAQETSEDRVSGLAAETAFFALLALFPGLLMIAAALGSLEAFVGSEVATEAEQVIVSFLQRILTERASAAVAAVEDLFERDRGGLITLSVAVSVAALARGYAAVIRALDLAYDVKERRSWIRQRAVSFGLAIGSVFVAALVLVAFVAGPMFGGGRAVADALGVGRHFALAWTVLRWPGAFALVVSWAATVYYFGPGRRGRWRAELPGALLTAVLWVAASGALNLYVRIAAARNPVLGSLGGGVIMLVWLYLLSFGLLVGGELNAILTSERSAGRTAEALRTR